MRPSQLEILADELNSVRTRLERTAVDGRAAFRNGSDSYDRAVVAVVRLASLFENEAHRYGVLLASVTERERRGIVATRNIAAHQGYAAMDEDEFWHTVTVDMPDLIERLRVDNGI